MPYCYLGWKFEAPRNAGMSDSADDHPRIAMWLLMICGVWLVCLGIWFVFVRPPLLPEDPRFMGTSLDAIRAAVPGLEGWLRKVFTVLGGFMAGTGVLVVFLSRTLTTTNFRSATTVFTVSGLLTVVLMSATNFALQSDFRWFLLVPALLWFIAIACLVARK
jgi:hypothetical protein